MSTREQVTLIHELEAHGLVIVCGDDEELTEAICYELDGRESDNETYT